jgi:hypothetical protein
MNLLVAVILDIFAETNQLATIIESTKHFFNQESTFILDDNGNMNNSDSNPTRMNSIRTRRNGSFDSSDVDTSSRPKRRNGIVGTSKT